MATFTEAEVFERERKLILNMLLFSKHADEDQFLGIPSEHLSDNVIIDVLMEFSPRSIKLIPDSKFEELGFIVRMIKEWNAFDEVINRFPHYLKDLCVISAEIQRSVKIRPVAPLNHSVKNVLRDRKLLAEVVSINSDHREYILGQCW